MHPIIVKKVLSEARAKLGVANENLGGVINDVIQLLDAHLEDLQMNEEMTKALNDRYHEIFPFECTTESCYNHHSLGEIGLCEACKLEAMLK